MGVLDKIIYYLPEVRGPKQKRLSFNTKLKWTLIVLVSYFIMGLIPLFGLGVNSLERFEFLSVVLGANFGSLISLGIGPLVTASIVMQLLVGTNLLKIDLNKPEGRRKFEGMQKLLSILLILFEAYIFVKMQGLSPGRYYDPSTRAFLPEPAQNTIPLTNVQYSLLEFLLVLQLCLGGFLIMLMDEIVSKWGFGSGISLFIAAGVSKAIVIRAFSWIKSTGMYPVGAIPTLILALRNSDPTTALLQLSTLFFTVIVFLIAVYAQAMKIEIPLSYERVRGYGIRWPLSFIYTSNIPVILTAALLMNIQLFSSLLENVAANSSNKIIQWISIYVFGQINGPHAGHGIVRFTQPPSLINALVTGSLTSEVIVRAIGYVSLMIIGSIIFSVIWVHTAGLDAKTVAKRLHDSGLQIPGFRKDPRILERLLNRYIWPLTIMGAILVGFLAAMADLTNALSRGTGILLTVMIIYRLYEEIAKQHMIDMHPLLRKMFESS